MAKNLQKMIPYSRQWVDEDDIEEVIEILRSDFVTQGPKITEFEKALAAYVGAKYAVAFSSGTAALHGACSVVGISDGDEVIAPTLSFVASANCVLYCQGKPVLVDVSNQSLTIDVSKIEEKITKKTKAIIAVDFAGHPADWDKLKKLAKKNNLVLIDDAAHALGSKYQNRPIGSIADMTVFSFHPVKTITTGEGGAVTTNNWQFWQKLSAFRNHGMLKSAKLVKDNGGWFYDIASLGYNYRMTDMQAALGISQLGKIDRFIKRRRKIWQKYNQAFGGIRGLVLPREQADCFCAWHLYTLRIDEKVLGKSRREIFDKLRKVGVGVQVHYIPIHMHSLYFQKFGYRKGDFPVAEQYYKEAISLPLFPKMTKNEVGFVIDAVKNVCFRFAS